MTYLSFVSHVARPLPSLTGLLVLAVACSSSSGGNSAPDAAPDVVLDVALDVSPDATPEAALDVAPDVSLDVARDVSPDVAPDVPRDVAPDAARDAPLDRAADVARDAAPGSCASNRDCPRGTVCEYAMGCDQMGSCRSDLCGSLPVAPQYCGCDGRTIQQTSACLPDRAWRAMGACRDAGAADATSDAGARFADAVMLWQSPGGFAGWGPAVMVSGDGVVRFWRMRSMFTIASAASVPADSTERVTPAEAEELFSLWSMVDTSRLPHRTMGSSDCYPSVTVRRCATCTNERIAYTTPMSLLPEINAVWAWFDRRYPARSPRGYCAF